MADVDSVGSDPVIPPQLPEVDQAPAADTTTDPSAVGRGTETEGPSEVARRLQADTFADAGDAQRRWFDKSDRFEPTGPVRDGAQTLDGRAEAKAAREIEERRQREKATDGLFVGPNGISANKTEAGAFRPADGKLASEQPIYFTNGINTTSAEHAQAAQALAERTRRPVFAVHNATEGAVWDVTQAMRQKTLGADTPPTQTLTREINGALARGEKIDIYGHSQGAIDVSNAINAASRDLYAQGLNRQQVEQRLGNITAHTFGGAAQYFADGPQYTHHMNSRDPVAAHFGLGGAVPPSTGWHPGRGAVMDRQRQPGDSHAFANYLQWAVPQAQVN